MSVEIDVKVRYSHTPASFGAEITETVTRDGEAESTTCSIVNPRGTDALWFTMKRSSDGQWSRTHTMTGPERFMPRPCRTAKDFTRVVAAWNAASEESIRKEYEEGRP